MASSLLLTDPAELSALFWRAWPGSTPCPPAVEMMKSPRFPVVPAHNTYPWQQQMQPQQRGLRLTGAIQ